MANQISADEVKSFLTSWARSYDEGSSDFFASFAPSASVFTLSSPTRIDGREEYKRGFEPYFGSGNRRSQILSPSIDVYGDAAVATFHNRVNIDNNVSNSRTTVVVNRGEGGKLQITHLHQSPLGQASVVGGVGAAPASISLLEERVATAAAAVGTPK